MSAAPGSGVDPAARWRSDGRQWHSPSRDGYYHWDLEEIMEICAEYAAGLSLAQVANWHGTYPATIHQLLIRARQPVRTQKQGCALRKGAHSPAFKGLVVAAYRKGASGSRVARRFGISWNTVIRWVEAADQG